MKKLIRAFAARSVFPIVCLLAVASAFLWGGAEPEQQSANTAPTPQAIQPPAAKRPEPGKPLKSAPAKLSEVQSAIARVYKDSVTVDSKNFLVGDFDGDGSQDMVAVVSPVAAMLPSLNSEYARWKLEDPRQVTSPVLEGLPQNSPPAPVRAEEGERLLVVIHGSGPDGWRNPDAMNTYLLKNAVGSSLSPQPLRQALVEAKSHRSKKDLLALRGDVIRQTLGREKGFLFWTGADYAWHSLDNQRAIDRRPIPSPHTGS
ncbi:MAG TPA: hypothetical protein VJZ91_07240 [Blastocatellia bacterium]|nr:hypothetical protein [Blastocatellia bacterium]